MLLFFLSLVVQTFYIGSVVVFVYLVFVSVAAAAVPDTTGGSTTFNYRHQRLSSTTKITTTTLQSSLLSIKEAFVSVNPSSYSSSSRVITIESKSSTSSFPRNFGTNRNLYPTRINRIVSSSNNKWRLQRHFNYWGILQQQQQQQQQQQRQLVLYSSSDLNEDYDNDINSMRLLLEQSWNCQTMGQIPTSASSAAIEASLSIQQAIIDNNSKNDNSQVNNNINNNNIFFIDILLPQYDLRQSVPTTSNTANTANSGTSTSRSLFDEILVAEFCISLAKELSIVNLQYNDKTDSATTVKININNKCNIIVKDDTILSIIQRIFNKRENRDITAITGSTSIATTTITTTTEEKQSSITTTNDSTATTSSYTGSSIIDNDDLEYYDDFADFGIIGDSDSTTTTTTTTTEQVSVIESKSSQSLLNDEYTKSTTIQQQASNYRFSSMFGTAMINNKISTGPDMYDDVINAIQSTGSNATTCLPTHDENIILFVSSTTQEELYGIQAIVEKYTRSNNNNGNNTNNNKKLFILLNCNLSPPPSRKNLYNNQQQVQYQQQSSKTILPKIVRNGQTVYSFLPLIAKLKKSNQNQPPPLPSQDNNKNSTKEQEQSTTTRTKVVVLRRYPNDWEVYVDVNNDNSNNKNDNINKKGFQLAASISDTNINVNRKNGPSMEWIQKVVQQYFDTIISSSTSSSTTTS